MTNIKDKIKDLPKEPGVYHFIDEKGSVLYVGKAKNLQNRLRQYFLKELGRGPAIEQMVEKARDIKWIETESEIEAVILEAELIKKLKPKYNIRLKDDKSFLVIRITKEDFPIVELVRFRNVDLSDKSAWYFGPYPAGELLRKSLNYLRKIFPFRDCSKAKFNTYKKKQRTCIYGDIRVCSGPCNAWVNKSQYNKNIIYLKNFLRGKKGKIIADLEKEMKAFSRAQRFEQAALVRNKLAGLEHLKDVALGLRDDVFNGREVSFHRIEFYDIANIGKEHAVGSMVVFTDGKSDKDEYRKFKIEDEISPTSKTGGRNDTILLNNDLGRLKQVLQRRFKNDWPMPDLVLVDGGPLQLKIAKEVISGLGLNIPLASVSKGPRREKNDFHYGDLNIANFIGNDRQLQNILIEARDEAHRFAISYYRKLHRKSVFQNDSQ
ncbi:MAG: GIY-YIG nuclease family protein [Patescibacteria group bacterium]